MNTSAASGRSGKGLFQKPTQGCVDGFCSSGGRGEIQGNPNGTGTMEGTYRVHPLAFGPFSGSSSCRSELPYEGWFGKIHELCQSGDAETLQAMNDERVHREDGNRTGCQEGGELRIGNHDRSSWLGTGSRHPGAKFSRSPPHPGGSHQRTRKKLEESLEGDSHLSGGRTMEALQPIHPYKNPAPASRLHHRTQLEKSFHHLFLSGVIVCRIRLEESQGRAEGNSLGNQLTRANTRLGPTLRNLPQGAASSFARSRATSTFIRNLPTASLSSIGRR